MPTKREREYYSMGFRDGRQAVDLGERHRISIEQEEAIQYSPLVRGRRIEKGKRKLSPWNKFVKANSKKPRFRLRSGSPNLKKMGIAYRKTPAGKKSKRR
jgi:hypothetical protein